MFFLLKGSFDWFTYLLVCHLPQTEDIPCHWQWQASRHRTTLDLAFARLIRTILKFSLLSKDKSDFSSRSSDTRNKIKESFLDPFFSTAGKQSGRGFGKQKLTFITDNEADFLSLLNRRWQNQTGDWHQEALKQCQAKNIWLFEEVNQLLSWFSSKNCISLLEARKLCLFFHLSPPPH